MRRLQAEKRLQHRPSKKHPQRRRQKPTQRRSQQPPQRRLRRPQLRRLQSKRRLQHRPSKKHLQRRRQSQKHPQLRQSKTRPTSSSTCSAAARFARGAYRATASTFVCGRASPCSARGRSGGPIRSRGGPPLAQLSESRVLQKLLQLARDIRRPRAYIGYSALICFGLARGCRPFVWEGANRIDLIAAYAPWAIGRCTKECAVDAVVCCIMSAVAGGRVQMVPVSEMAPLSACNHLIAAVSMGDMLPGRGDSIEAFYSSMGMALLGTVVDGDCGIDAACQMLGLPQTADQRGLLREEPGPCQKSLGC